jgi:hypothetical protein
MSDENTPFILHHSIFTATLQLYLIFWPYFWPSFVLHLKHLEEEYFYTTNISELKQDLKYHSD